MSELLKIERDDGLVWLSLNRPEKLNSFTGELWEALRVEGQKLLADPSIRVLVVGGEGRAFSSGIDLSAFSGGMLSGASPVEAGEGGGGGDPFSAMVLKAQDAYTWLEEAPFVTIAMVHGYALGAGWQLALACDITIAAEGAQFGMLETKYGLVPDLGGTTRLARSIGVALAKELILTGRKIEADEAVAIGAVARVVGADELRDEAAKVAAEVIRRSPTAIRHAKRLVSESLWRPVREGLAGEAEAQSECVRSPDFVEAISAFMQKREPSFGAAASGS